MSKRWKGIRGGKFQGVEHTTSEAVFARADHNPVHVVIGRGPRPHLWAEELLAANHHVRAAVVTMPCWELFESQPVSYRSDVLGSAPRVAVEAAARLPAI